MASNPFIAFLEILATIAWVIGAIGLIVSITRPIPRRFWIILLVAGLVVMWIFTAAFPAEEEEEEEAAVIAVVEEEEEELAADAASRTSAEITAGETDGEATEGETYISPENTPRTVTTQSNEFWTMQDNADLSITLVAGDEKSVTLRFQNNIPDCTYDMCTFTQINVGSHLVYTADDDNGFTGISLSTRYNGEEWPRFFSYTSLVQGGYCEIEYYMTDGSDLPDTITFMFNETEQYWRENGTIDAYNIEGLTIELQRL